MLGHFASRPLLWRFVQPSSTSLPSPVHELFELDTHLSNHIFNLLVPGPTHSSIVLVHEWNLALTALRCASLVNHRWRDMAYAEEPWSRLILWFPGALVHPASPARSQFALLHFLHLQVGPTIQHQVPDSLYDQLQVAADCQTSLACAELFPADQSYRTPSDPELDLEPSSEDIYSVFGLMREVAASVGERCNLLDVMSSILTRILPTLQQIFGHSEFVAFISRPNVIGQLLQELDNSLPDESSRESFDAMAHEGLEFLRGSDLMDSADRLVSVVRAALSTPPGQRSVSSWDVSTQDVLSAIEGGKLATLMIQIATSKWGEEQLRLCRPQDVASALVLVQQAILYRVDRDMNCSTELDSRGIKAATRIVCNYLEDQSDQPGTFSKQYVGAHAQRWQLNAKCRLRTFIQALRKQATEDREQRRTKCSIQ